MLPMPFGNFFLLIYLGITSAATAYYAAVISGLFKEPMMAQFRAYGEEKNVSPLVRFLIATGLLCFGIAFLIRKLTTQGRPGSVSYAATIFWVGMFVAFASAWIVTRQPALRESLPRWYFDLLRTATRQERRFIGYAWLRIPRKMRWRLNGDQAAFRTWADMVRITVTYGAYDPANPWNRWT